MATVIRASSLPGYSDCPRRWAAQTIGRELQENNYNPHPRMPRSVGASVGTATHSGVAHMLIEKMNSGVLGNKTESEQCAITDFEKALQEADSIWDEVTPNISDAHRQIVRMVNSYRHYIAPAVTPISIERRLEANVGDDFVLSGQSDVQALEQFRLRDTKTGKSLRKHYAQIGSYSLLIRTFYPDTAPTEICTDFIPRAPLKDAQPEPITEMYDQATAEQAAVATIDRIKQDVGEFRRRIETGDKPPEHAFLANPSSGLCNPKWCPAFATNFCKEHRNI